MNKNKKNRTGRLTSLLLTLLLAVSLFPQTAFALTAQPEDPAAGAVEEALEEISIQAGKNDDTFAPEKGFTLKAAKSAKPQAFDLRSRGLVTSVKLQDPFGSCWGFSAIAAAESSILEAGLAEDAGSLDLSEKQIVWFAATAIDDPDSPLNGEGIQYDIPPTDKARYDLGGFTVYATNLFASGAGPVSEDALLDGNKVYEYRGKTGNALVSHATWYDPETGQMASGKKRLYYDMKDDWSIPESGRFRQEYAIRESYLLPTPVTKDEYGTCTYHPEATEAIKAELLEGHAISVSFHADHSKPGEITEEEYLNPDTWAHYTWTGEEKPNHAVTIVGYNDNYSKNNFSHKPEGDGAWLVKNSWGADSNEFPNNGYSHWGLQEGQDIIDAPRPPEASSPFHTGYFWISYYDKCLETPETYSFEKADENTIIHQHDCMPVPQYQEYATDAEIRMANIFQADRNARLSDISLFTATPGTTASYKIYLLTADAETPEEGVCVYESSPKTYTYGGYHREKLPDDAGVIVAQKQKYSIIVEEKTPGGKSSISFGQGLSRNDTGSYYFHAVVDEGQSMLCMDGSWVDLADKEVKTVLSGGREDVEIDNLPIKSYLKPVENGGASLVLNPFAVADTGEETAVLNRGSRLRFDAYFRGGNSDIDQTISWSVLDDSLVSIDPNPSNDSTAVLTVLKNGGNTYLIVDAGIYGKKVIHIKVLQFSLTYASIAEEARETVYTGSPHEPKVTEVIGQWDCEEEIRDDLAEGQDYTVSYENNIKCGLGSAIVTGTGDFCGEVSGAIYSELLFLIHPAKAKINKVTPGTDSLTVSIASQKDSGISGYVLSWREAGSSNVSTKKLAASDTSAVIDGLTAGKSYEVSLKAYVTVLKSDFGFIYNREADEYEEVEKVDYYGEESDWISGTPQNSSEEESQKKESTAPSKPSDGKASDPSSVAGTAKKIAAIKKDGDLPGSSFRILRLQSKSVTRNSIRLNWQKVKNADGYILYGNKCGTKYKFKKLATLSAAKKTWSYKKLKKGSYYKFLIVAYRIRNNTKKITASSKTIHVATSGGKVGNYKSIKLSKKKITLKKGKSTKLKVTTKRASKKLKVKKHRKTGFESSNKNIATVTKTGKITAKKKGSCIIYAYTQNGLWAKVKVTVR